MAAGGATGRYDADQRRTIREVIAVGQEMDASPKVLEAAIETILTESNARNLDHGDRDSQGAFQQRPGQGWGRPGSVRQDARDFFERAIPLRRKYGTSGELAQAVQRSAFPDRYEQRDDEAEAILRSFRGGEANGGREEAPPSRGGGGIELNAVGSTDRSGERYALAQQFLSDKLGAPEFVLCIQGAQDDPGQTLQIGEEQTEEQRVVEGEGDALGPASLQDGGGWGGTKNLAMQAAAVGRGLGFEAGSEKRTPAENRSVGGSATSHHLTTNKRAYAVDIRAAGDDVHKVGKAVAKKFGVKYVPDSYNSGGTVEINGNRYRVQILGGAAIGHDDHLHVGFEAL